ncbi:MAG: preprotein translocase subunit SecE [Caulobacteraceae bacterium]|nr:preprotein translocase subunit SecE [Caulobacter sp.]RYF89863.1 MAG: preprotein translocase subunit SecE [Caulobacteraceae bacterium]
MAKKPGNLAAMKSRAAKSAAVVAAPAGAAPAEPKKPRTSIPEFIRQVRAEGRKITWTTWKETWITSIMVFIMVIMAALFFLLVDWMLSNGVRLVLELVSGTAQ